MRIFCWCSEAEPSCAKYWSPNAASRPAARWVAIWSTTFSPLGDVVRLVDEQRHPRAVGLGQVDLALELGVQHSQDEQHARLAVLGPDRAHVGVDDQDVPGLDDLPQRHVGRVVEEPSQRRHAGEPGDLVARRVEPLGDAAGGHPQVVGQLGAEELGGLVEVGLVRARLGDRVSELIFRGAKQRVDVLEPGAAALLVRRSRSRR